MLAEAPDTFGTEFRMANSGMAWMNNETKEVVTVTAADLKWASWMRVARNFRLRLGLEKGRRENFEGFTRDVRVIHHSHHSAHC